MRNEIRNKINYLDALQDILAIVDNNVETLTGFIQEEEEDNGLYDYYNARMEIWREIQKFLEKKI